MIYEIIFNLSFFYIIAYFLASIFGLYMRYFHYNFVYATYEQDGMQVTEKFPSVLIIDDDFIYFEKNEMNCWKSIPKPKVSLMETKKEKNTRFRELVISKYPWVVENDKKIKCLLFLALIVYFVTFSANIFSPILPAFAVIVAIICVILIH